MPLTGECRHVVELHKDLRANQGMSLLTSSEGRYLWSERPFFVRICRRGNRAEWEPWVRSS